MLFVALARFDLGQFLQRLLHPLDSLPQGPLTRRLTPPIRTLVVGFFRELTHRFARLFEMPLERRTPALRPARGLRPDPRAVDGHLLEIHQPLLTQQRQYLCQQVLESF